MPAQLGHGGVQARRSRTGSGPPTDGPAADCAVENGTVENGTVADGSAIGAGTPAGPTRGDAASHNARPAGALAAAPGRVAGGEAIAVAGRRLTA
ncbi:hypothetical protein FRACA_270028 [Frankia canadensis]|uniref:Uncharacterized protein n=1 Tax=Frankia canadensis TaxID=1836972 RepID=A0A2I2KSR2_9ACTN|nr:hypothetical protein [Frankia canadensis]SNQ48711.1 hypothetical protein FRACA_270028 [Frankia canadensis]SOU56001.1 hypothetical protein FRACA_270028 [Frankia canadensis]